MDVPCLVMSYAGYLLGGWLDPKYLHVTVLIILASVCSAPIICIRLASLLLCQH